MGDERHRENRMVVANCRILAKAGYPLPLALLSIVSPVNLVLVLIFAFREWPLERELRHAREAAERSSPASSEPAT